MCNFSPPSTYSFLPTTCSNSLFFFLHICLSKSHTSCTTIPSVSYVPSYVLYVQLLLDFSLLVPFYILQQHSFFFHICLAYPHTSPYLHRLTLLLLASAFLLPSPMHTSIASLSISTIYIFCVTTISVSSLRTSDLFYLCTHVLLHTFDSTPTPVLRYTSRSLHMPINTFHFTLTLNNHPQFSFSP